MPVCMAKRPRLTIDCDHDLVVAIKLAALEAGDVSVSDVVLPVLRREFSKQLKQAREMSKTKPQKND